MNKTMHDNIAALANKYSPKNGYKGDIFLKKGVSLPSRGSIIEAFYVYENWIYLLDEEGNDIDPNYVEIEFLETFTDYIADERNIDTV